MHVKEQGWVLSIDQASNSAGVTLWYCGELKHWTTLLSASPKDTIARRLQTQVPQLTSFLDAYLPASATITQLLFEGVRARLVLVTVGAFLTCPRIDAKLHQSTSFVESTSWKKWAQSKGATGLLKDVKGVRSLRETGFPVDALGITNDDVADSIMQYLTWREWL